MSSVIAPWNGPTPQSELNPIPTHLDHYNIVACGSCATSQPRQWPVSSAVVHTDGCRIQLKQNTTYHASFNSNSGYACSIWIHESILSVVCLQRVLDSTVQWMVVVEESHRWRFRITCLIDRLLGLILHETRFLELFANKSMTRCLQMSMRGRDGVNFTVDYKCSDRRSNLRYSY